MNITTIGIDLAKSVFQDLEASHPSRPCRVDGQAHGAGDEIRVACRQSGGLMRTRRPEYQKSPTLTGSTGYSRRVRCSMLFANSSRSTSSSIDISRESSLSTVGVMVWR